MNVSKKKKRLLNSYVIIFIFLCLATLSTYLIPAGIYDVVEGGSTVDPNSFHFVERTPTTLMQFLTAFPRGLVKNNSMIFLIMLTGGFFQVVNDTKALDRSLTRLMQKMGRYDLLVLPVIMIIMALLGATGVVINAVLAFVPLGMTLAKRLRLDPMMAVSMTFGACYIGFSASPMCPLTLQYAQTLAGVEPLSNFGFRLVVCIVCLAVTIGYAYRYSKRIRSDMANSLVYGFQWEEEDEAGDIELSWKEYMIDALLILGLGVFTYGTIKLNWATNTLPGILLVVALLSGAIAHMHPNDIVDSFIKGAKAMTYSAMLVGLASSICLILSDANVIHTIVRACASPMSSLGKIGGGIFLYIFNTAVNFLIPSGSGQASVVIPLLAPLCEVTGNSKELMICMFKYGDGFSNTIFPTISVLMGSLGVAKIDYGKWLKYQVPLFGIISAIVVLTVFAGVWLGI